jgi:tetratricopeptide (TPR) repeat protein
MTRRQVALLYAGLLALTVVAYLPLWNNDFIDFDDEVYITANPQVLRGLSGSGFGWAWTTLHGAYWQPLSWLSLQADAHFFSREVHGHRLPSPAAFHAQNLFWHAASTLLLFAVWQRLTGARWRSFLVAGLFAVHPLHVESVAWATERKDVLSCFFGILTLWAYARYLDRPGWLRYLAVAGAFALSLLSKPMLMTLPFVLLLLDYWPLRRLSLPIAPAAVGRLLLEKVPLFLLTLACAIITETSRMRVGAEVSLNILPLSARLANAGTAYGWYLAHTFWPVHLAVLYPHPLENWSAGAALAGTATLLAGTGLAVWQGRRRGWLVTGWFWFVGSLLPVIGLFQGGAQAWADRFTYWPHIGLFVAVVWQLAEWANCLRLSVTLCRAAGAVVLGCLGVLTWVQVGYWHDTRTVWEWALAVTHDNDLAHLHLGKYYLEQSQFDRAERHLAEAVRLKPDIREYRSAFGIALLSLGKLDEAAEQFREALDRNPHDADTWHNLGTTRLRQGKPEMALRCFRQALELEPNSADNLDVIGLALWRQGKREEAYESFDAALRQNPDDARALYGLGSAHLDEGDTQQAITELTRALQLDPGLVNARSELGVALGRSGDWRQAARLQRQAVEMQDESDRLLAKMNGRSPLLDSLAPAVVFRCRLAFALNRLEDRQEAARVYREALDRDPSWPRKFTEKAWLLATATDENLRAPQLAYELARTASEAVAEPSAALLDALAAAQAGLGQFQDAAQTAQQALDRATANGDTTLAASIRERLRLYRNGKPAMVNRP